MKVSYHNDFTIGGFVHHWHKVYSTNVLKYPHHYHNNESLPVILTFTKMDAAVI